MNQVFTVQSDIVEAFHMVSVHGFTEEKTKEVIARLNERVKHFKLVRDRYACSTLITALYQSQVVFKQCLAYEFEGVLYCTSKRVKDRPNTDYLHTKGFTSKQWDELPRWTVWIDTGIVYGKSPA